MQLQGILLKTIQGHAFQLCTSLKFQDKCRFIIITFFLICDIDTVIGAIRTDVPLQDS